MRKHNRRPGIFDSLSMISLLILVAMVLTMITGSGAAERDPALRQQSLFQSHLADPQPGPVVPHTQPAHETLPKTL